MRDLGGRLSAAGVSPKLLAAVGNNASAFSHMASNAAQLSSAAKLLQALDAHAAVVQRWLRAIWIARRQRGRQR